MRERMLNAGVMKRFQSVSRTAFDMKSIRPENRKAVEEVWAYADDIKKHVARGEGLILSGPPGTTKTTLAIAVLRQGIEEGRLGYFIPMVSLLDNIMTMSRRDKEEAFRFEDRLRNVPLLVLDDLGAEHSSDWVMTKVDAIVTERYNREKAMIITTNLDRLELMSRFNARIIDRLKSVCKTIRFEGKSQRPSVDVEGWRA